MTAPDHAHPSHTAGALAADEHADHARAPHAHDAAAHAAADPGDRTAPEYWDDRYREGRVWNDGPNPSLARVGAELAPGRALDLGCGEGGDARWLAAQGWQVVGADVSQVALDRAAALADEAGLGDTIVWERHDLDESFPSGAFDLVTAHYVHTPLAFQYDELLRRAGSVVAPGGTLLVVGHTGRYHWYTGPGPVPTFATTDDVLAAARSTGIDWQVLEAADFDRVVVAPDGTTTERTDCVVRLVRAAESAAA